MPIPNEAPAEIAPIMIVSKLEQYHLAPVTKLFPKPKTKRKNTATSTVIQIKLLFKGISFTLAANTGINGMNPKMQKLKKVMILFLIGFSSPAIN